MTDLLFSQSGQVVIVNTTAAPTSNYYAVQVLADAVIASIVYDPGYDITGSWASFTVINAGTVLAGRFKTLTLTSGQVILHKE
jgi:hypothetical protein